MQLKQKIALITGSSKGIGKVTAISLAKEGSFVIINYTNDLESANQVLEECNKYSSNNIVVKCDIRNESDVSDMFLEIHKHYGSLDILVNNAGIWASSGNPNDLEIFDEIYNMNFKAQIRVTEQFLKLAKQGKIVNVSSIHGRLGHGNPSGIAYSALKAGFDSYTKNLAKALAPNILVNAVAPGRTLTPMWGEMPDTEVKELGEGQLINRFINPEEVAAAIVFLLKNDAMCGEILTIDGGMSLKTLG